MSKSSPEIDPTLPTNRQASKRRRWPKKHTAILIDTKPVPRGRKRKPLEPYIAPSEEDIAAGKTDHCRLCSKEFLLTDLTRQAMYCINCQRAYTRSKIKKATLKQRYGLSEREYKPLVREAKGVCSICLNRFDKSRRCMAVDHDHKTGAVRGVVCSLCNAGLGHFKDKPALLRKAAKYVEKFTPSEQGFPGELYIIDHLYETNRSPEPPPHTPVPRRKRGTVIVEEPKLIRKGAPRKPIPPYIQPSDDEIKSGLTKTCPMCKRQFLSEAIKHYYCIECQRLDGRSRLMKTHLKAKYGLSTEQYQAMLKATRGRCPICFKGFKQPGHWPDVDHDHKTGAVRDIICHHCNVGLGRFEENIEAMENAALYLEASRRKEPPKPTPPKWATTQPSLFESA
jgi:hypothetical protein